MKTLILATCAMLITFAALNVTGTYKTDFGTLKLTQAKTNVTGTYSYPANGETVNGTVKGTLSENILTFTWEQKQGPGKAGGTGTFTFAKDGKSFKGVWVDSKGQTGNWNGTR